MLMTILKQLSTHKAGRKILEGILSCINYYEKYGSFAWIILILIIFKVFLFYNLMGITANLFFSGIVTLVIIAALFLFIHKKWIAFSVYAAFSVLMFCDCWYCSYFNHYLSLALIGEAAVVGDIAVNVFGMLSPAFFLLFLDLLVLVLMFSGHKLESLIPFLTSLKKTGGNA